MVADEFLKTLKEGLDDKDQDSVRSLCETQASLLKNSPLDFSQEQARLSLRLLRKDRRFHELLVLSEAMLHWFDHDPELKRQYGQALIENGHLLAAAQWLTQCESEIQVKEGKEWGQIVGLLGRTHKQKFSDRREPDDLRKAFSWYDLLYSKDNQALWHGINVVCLGAIAEKEGISLPRPTDYKQIATNILLVIKNKPLSERTCWDEITIAEAFVALGQPEHAIKFVESFCLHEDVGSFAIDSALRQFDDLWQLDEMEGDYLELIDILRSSLMQSEGGEIVTGVDHLNRIAINYERRFTSAGPIPRTWFLQLVDCSNFVGRVWHKSLYGCGTGFLVDDAGDLYDKWKGFQVFVTCNHVISNLFNSEGALFPNEVTITFDSLEKPGNYDPVRHTIKQILWESPRTEWDVTIVQLAKREDRIHQSGRGKSKLDILQHPNRMPRSKEERVYIVGHPEGGEMSFSFQDNQFIEGNERRIQYITPTDPGSSGSPVFDQHLNLIAMHHAGGEFMESLTQPGVTRKANQGIPLPAIIQAIQSCG